MQRLSFYALLRLACLQLLRDARAGELRVLFLALLIAVTASTSIGYFSARLSGAMQMRASEFLGADLLLNGSTPATPQQIAEGLAQQLKHAQLVEFASVIATDNGIQLASVKAVDSAYPLRGQLKSASALEAGDTPGGGPKPGEAWVEARLLLALNLQIGQNIEVGNKTLQLSRVLTYEPDRAGDFYSLSPRVLMHLDDLPATGVIQPGSRVSYRELWRGNPTQLAAYRNAIEPSLTAQQKFDDPHSGNRQIGSALGRAERYLNLASLAAVLLAGVAVALSAARFANRRLDASALLRCLGLSRHETLLLFSLQLALLGLLACTLGAALGWLAQHGLFYLLRGLLPANIPPGNLLPALAGMACGLIALGGFALPPLAALGRVPPLRVLRRDLLPVPPSSWLVYGAALLALGLIMWRLSLDLPLTLALLGGGLLTALLLGGVLLLSLQGLRRLLRNASLAWRLGVGQLLRQPLAAAGQSLAFGLILLSMALIALLRSELLSTWQAQLPAQTPNLFALNVLPAEKDAFLARLHQLSPTPALLYPALPGRLIAINGQPLSETANQDGRNERALNRDLSLSWSAELPPGNRLVAGAWWPATATAQSLPGVSIEASLAKNLNIGLGDRLSFTLGAVQRDAQVRSVREVQWDSLQPNFYMIFEPGALQDLPATYLTSFYLPTEQQRQLIELARAFPAVTLLQVDVLLEQLRAILAQVTLAVEWVLLFVLAAGFTVLFAGLQSTLDERIRQSALLRALGAQRRLLNQARLREFALLGATSGLIAALGCELISALLYRLVFNIDWQPHLWLLGLPLVGAALVAGAGLLGTRRALNVSPLTVLREG